MSREVRRGYYPSDKNEFGIKAIEKLNKSAKNLYYLLNEGYNVKSASTFVGNHYLLSERQRLALARVILADRPMIIFDEATSNIDVESEESIWEAIYELSKNKTILVISHRLANVKDAKKIYVMNKGNLVESGSHDELMSREKYYYDMVNKQNELEMIREVC